MKVTLIDYQSNALELLLYTKNTRLQGAQSFEDIMAWPMERKLGHLDYMRHTIQSSWEFVAYTFHIEGVTRAFTHQLIRTRQGSYAQQSQRTVDVRDQPILNTSKKPVFDYAFDDMAGKCRGMYAELIDRGMEIQDARGILPTNMTTEIVAKFDLRTLHNTALVRLCTRTQGEYQKVFKAMVAEVIKVHPWAEPFIKAQCAWNGICAFPNYNLCPVQEYTIKTSKKQLATIQRELNSTDHVANPVARDGKTM